MTVGVDSISYEGFDSSKFATFPESIADSKVNPLLLVNLSDKLVVNLDSEEVILQDPTCTFKDMLHFFKPYYASVPVLPTEKYRPEMTAKRLYGSADLWEILLLVNNISTVMEYDKETINYIPNDKLTKITKFVQLHKGLYRTVQEDDLATKDLL
jgi:hypothetical protein